MAMTSYLDDFNVDAETKQVLDLAFEMTPAASGPRGCASEQRDELASSEASSPDPTVSAYRRLRCPGSARRSLG
jgi:hypothetical protein